MSSTVELSAFPSSTEGVRFLKTFTYNQQQYIHVDSNMGICVANTALSKLQAKHFNSQSSFLVDMFYWHNDNVWMPFLWCKSALPLSSPAEPKVRVSVLKLGSLPQTNWSASYAMGFYLLEMNVKSFQNGCEEMECVMFMDMFQNWNWT
ncbi:class II histocompatibility antigen, B-L beta chain-like isoform X2 [Numida meleagris]|uniref:class II histocompatibility antigen, B-L beta chain-like isoform X2 n=1 Tax=Numida meleagris TaxID=8996 RepID=UPI000B3DBAA6|nr:class II histocompatibility antigen, B-L beta chain-like isoform X2 [Numida meleagris]